MKMGHFFVLVLYLTIALFFAVSAQVFASGTKGPDSIERISVEEARTKVQAGKALLVCSYGDKKCKGMLLEGAILRSEFEKKLPHLPKDQEIIFYCG